ncbi:MAG: AAA family ATPase [Saprospiraceae bacterium]|nr:AAA family ATPase [Saprospiraceae bacterium]
MLDHLVVQNYRLFKDLNIPKLGQVNLITGKNNAGKSTLLEVIG